MKVDVDGKRVTELNETQKKIIKNDIRSSIFQDDMERRIKWVLIHKYEQCFKRLKEEWEPKLVGRVDSIPLDPEKFAELIFSQPDYKDREAREMSSD